MVADYNTALRVLQYRASITLPVHRTEKRRTMGLACADWRKAKEYSAGLSMIYCLFARKPQNMWLALRCGKIVVSNQTPRT
jgi:hypothetical protein